MVTSSCLILKMPTSDWSPTLGPASHELASLGYPCTYSKGKESSICCLYCILSCFLNKQCSPTNYPKQLRLPIQLFCQNLSPKFQIPIGWKSTERQELSLMNLLWGILGSKPPCCSFPFLLCLSENGACFWLALAPLASRVLHPLQVSSCSLLKSGSCRWEIRGQFRLRL